MKNRTMSGQRETARQIDTTTSELKLVFAAVVLATEASLFVGRNRWWSRDWDTLSDN